MFNFGVVLNLLTNLKSNTLSENVSLFLAFLNKSHIFLFLILIVFLFTPFLKVFASTEVLDNITSDTTWTLAESPYVINSSIAVENGATLSIEPGVVVKFDYDTELIVDGVLNASGTRDLPIYFTSIADDTVGGDTNADGEDSMAYKGDWNFIVIENSSDKSILNNVFQKYSHQ